MSRYLLLFALLLVPDVAAAIPTFARKYQTSCLTCHVVPPKLTPFGQAFRRNGFRFPAGSDADMRKEEAVALGQPAHADVFPDAVWPADLPGTVPVSFIMQGGLLVSKELDAAHGHGAQPALPPAAGHAEGDWGTQLKPTEIALLLGGTLGETMAFFGKVGFSSGEGSAMVERPHLLWTPGGAKLGVRAGLFDPGLTPALSAHRNAAGHDLLFTTVSLGDNGWAPEPEQAGLEAFGAIVDGRLGYVVGVVEGSGNEANRAKDVYGRLEYKVGGMRLDGEGGTTETKPWYEWSVTAGGYVYKGFATFDDPGGSGERQSDSFLRAGGDVDLLLGDLDLVLGAFYQTDERPVFGSRDSGNLLGAVAQLDYVLFPWLVPSARYELFRQTLPGIDDGASGHRVLLALNLLARANVAVRLIGRLAKDRDDHFELRDGAVLGSWAF